MHIFSSLFIKIAPSSCLSTAKSGLIRCFSIKLNFVKSSMSFSLINFSPYPILGAISSILFNMFSFSCLDAIISNLQFFIFLAILILVTYNVIPNLVLLVEDE